MNKGLWLRTILGKFRIHNSINLLRKKGYLMCPNGFSLNFNEENKKDIKKLFEFSIRYGVKFSQEQGFWNYKDNIVILPNGMKFFINKFDFVIFAETFLYDIHFTDFDLENKVIVQAGGFTGDTALYYASRGAIVFSFEPDINSFNQAIANIGLNPDLSKYISMKNYAVGYDGEIEFPIDPEGSSASSANYTKGKNTIKVESVSIKTILEKFNINMPFLLDLDIKGNEFDIIRDNTISKFKMIRIEYSTVIGDKKLGSRDELIEKLRDYGFKKIRIFKHNELLFDLTDHGTIEAVRTST